jgi:hypothetical protein
MALAPDRTRLAEHFALCSPLSLEDLCEAIRRCFSLPEFDLDCENETEWGSVFHEGLEYNVSRPFEDGTLQAWDSSVPAGCNFGVSISVCTDRGEPRDAEHSAAQLVPRIGQALADLLRVPIHHHRTWLGPGHDITRAQVFRPST